MSKGTSKAQLRGSKAGKYQKIKEVEEEEDEEEVPQNPSWIQENFPDPVSMIALVSLVVMVMVLSLLIWASTTGGIEPYTRNGPLDVQLLDTVQDKPPSARSKDKDDLLETYAAVDHIERAVQHGNLVGARHILDELRSSKILTESDIEALRTLIDDAEALTPIVNISECDVTEVMKFVEEKGGKFIQADGTVGVMLADFDQQDQEQPDGRGRGVASLAEAADGTVMMQVPVSSGMHVWAAEKSPTFGKIVKNEKLKSLPALALFLLHESHALASPHRKHICSLPLHVPLPFLWADTDLPADFLAHEGLSADRATVKELVDLSYNLTVPTMLDKYPDMFTASQLTHAKWSWACSIVLSRSLAVSKKGMMGSFALENATLLDPLPQIQVLRGEAKETAFHVLLPAIDMINHESSDELSCKLNLASDGTATVTASPAGLKRGYEIAVSYGDHLCGTRPLNRYGFVLPACPGEEEQSEAPGGEGGEGGQKPEE
mmetsp:Transcript_21263/g.42903  ORF Transcript_21263/g.42903 Transcript_21263/m.42903 type:complete len:490 (+) Transcript_21263:167-1636(+)